MPNVGSKQWQILNKPSKIAKCAKFQNFAKSDHTGTHVL